MEKEILTKISRYVELSKKFQKSEREIFEKLEKEQLYLNTNCGTFTIAGNSTQWSFDNVFVLNGRELYIDEQGNVKAKDKQPITRAEKILAQAKLDAIVADEYDEYIKLQLDLESYFKSLENLTK